MVILFFSKVPYCKTEDSSLNKCVILSFSSLKNVHKAGGNLIKNHKKTSRYLNLSTLALLSYRFPFKSAMSPNLMDTEAGGPSSQYAIFDVGIWRQLTILPDTNQFRLSQLHILGKTDKCVVCMV